MLGSGRYTDLSAMLFRYQSEPFSPGDLLMNWKVKSAANFLNVLTLFVQDSGKDGDSRRAENAIDLGKQIDDHIGGEVCQNEMNAVTDNGIHGAAERPN